VFLTVFNSFALQLTEGGYMSLKLKLSFTLFFSMSILSSNVVSDELDKNIPFVSKAEQTMSFWDLPYLENAYISTTPDNRSDGLEVGDLSRITRKNIKSLNYQKTFNQVSMACMIVC